MTTHFVGFRGEEYWNAVRVWGRPDFIHRRWDLRAQRDIGPGETVVFARGDDSQTPSTMSGDDIDERYLPGGEFYERPRRAR